ncbi:MAG: GTPase HflX, partial [Pseudomonadota bacterium]
MLDRPDGGERAILVHVELAPPAAAGDPLEFLELARSAGVDPVAAVHARRDRPDPRYFVGEGKAR